MKTGSICDGVMTGVQAGGAQQPCRRELLTYIRSTADVCTSTAVGHNEDVSVVQSCLTLQDNKHEAGSA